MTDDGISIPDDFRITFNLTYPRDKPMPFQGAWPIDFWKLEETAFTKHPELWWPNEPSCHCGAEAAASYKSQYWCKEHLNGVLQAVSNSESMTRSGSEGQE